jgi:N6-L-threonylcarbamoyladenine synthase
VLGIESSCDDTACALLDGLGRVLSSVVSSQLRAHRRYGGVVPEIASREHLRNWPVVCREALSEAGVELAQVDVVAATRGPGLVGSLLVGLSLGKAIAYALKRPFHAVHHLEGHLYSPFLRASQPAEQPPEDFVGLVVSGGHTTLFQASAGRISTLAETRDDAMGECFDKIGKRIGLPFPGGAAVDVLAERGDPANFRFALARCGSSLDFSYSGLKTQALVELERLEAAGVATRLPPDDPKPPAALLDLLAGFRSAAVLQLRDRLERLLEQRRYDRLAVSGGVAANRLLRRELTAWAEERGVELRLVPLEYSGDNAAMIAWAALLRHRRGISDDPLTAVAASRIPV